MTATKKPKAADTVAVKTAAEFDVAAWLQDLASAGFKPRNVEVKMHLRGDLAPRMAYLVSEIQRLQSLEEVEQETGVDESDPLTELVAEYNQVQAEFAEGGHITFVFRPMNKRIQNTTFEEWREKFGPDAAKDDSEYLILMRMAASCVSFPGSDRFTDGIPAEAFIAFEDHYGTPAFNTLVSGFLEAYEAGGDPGAPFLPKRSPTQKTAGLSND